MKKFSWRIVTSTFFRYDRDSTIVDFKNGKTQILVATRWVFVENNHVYRSPFFKMLIGNLVYVLAAWMWRNWCLLWTTTAPTTMKTTFTGMNSSRPLCPPDFVSFVVFKTLLIFNIIVGLVESNNWKELQRGRKVFSGGHLSFPSVHCAQSRPHREGGQRGVRFHLHYQGAGSQLVIRSCEDGEAVLISIVFTRTFAQAIF